MIFTLLFGSYLIITTGGVAFNVGKLSALLTYGFQILFSLMGIIRLLYLDPGLGKSDGLPTEEEFSSPVLGRIYSAIRRKLADGANVNTGCLGEELSQNEMSLLVSILQKPETLANSRNTIRDYIEKMREQSGAQSSDLLAVLASRQKKEKDMRDKYGR